MSKPESVNESCSGCSMGKACQKKGKRCQAYLPVEQKPDYSDKKCSTCVISKRCMECVEENFKNWQDEPKVRVWTQLENQD